MRVIDVGLFECIVFVYTCSLDGIIVLQLLLISSSMWRLSKRPFAPYK